MKQLFKYLPLLMQVAAGIESAKHGGEIVELRPTVKGVKLRIQVARVPVSIFEVNNGKN